jgi:hypothetical protein
VFDDRSKRRWRLDRGRAGDAMRLRRSRVHLQRVCHGAKAEHGTGSGSGARRAGAMRCSPGVRARQSGEEQGAVAGVARGDPRRHSFRKRSRRVWRSTVAKHAGVLGPGHGCVMLPATTLVTSAHMPGMPGRGAWRDGERQLQYASKPKGTTTMVTGRRFKDKRGT